jgi:hypothetical membrane protein
MRFDDRTLAGLLFFIGGAQFIIGMVLAEGGLPAYSVSQNAISDLGVGSSAGLFNASVFLLGVLMVGGAFYFHRTHGKRWLTVLFFLSGAGAMGVGLFPETTGTPHGISALVAFLFGGVSTIATFIVIRGPLRWMSVLLGSVALVALALFAGGVYLGIGLGGMERMIAYPVLLWVTAFGGYLMSPAVPATTATPQESEKV